MAVIRIAGMNMQPAKEQHFRAYAGRRDRRQNGQAPIERRQDQAPASKPLKYAHRQPDPMGSRRQGRHGAQ